MGRAQPKSSPTDAHARRIARAIAQGKPPSFSAEFERYCESSPGEIFAAFAGAARHMPPAGNDEALAIGYLFLLQQLLEHLRYRTNQGYADAAKLIAEFQADVVRQAETGLIDGGMLAFVGGALHHSKIPASPDLVAASAQHADQNEHGDLPSDLHTALAGILDACEDDPFMVVNALLETAHALPGEVRSTLVDVLALADMQAARGAAVLFLLDPASDVRRAAAAGLARVAASLTPADVRRLIAVRNWRPEEERAEVDAVVRKARAAGIECAQWEAGRIETIAATAIDGAGTQGFLLISPAGRKKRLSSILTKGAIADAWIGQPESPRQLEANLADAGMPAATLAVSRAYLDRVVAHHLALGVARGDAPPLGLLEVAETIGGADWQPACMTFSETLAGLLAEVPKAMLEPATVASVLRKSADLADIEVIAQSWFEDDPEIAQAVGRAGRGNRAKRADYLLQSILARRRDKWADLILRTALWMREASVEADLCWRELAIVAKALADGRDMAEIGLMRDIASRTIAALTGPGRS